MSCLVPAVVAATMLHAAPALSQTALANPVAVIDKAATASQNLNVQVNITYVGKNNGWAMVPFERHMGLIFFQAVINGKPANVVLDNGFSHSVLSAEFARSIGVETEDLVMPFQTGTANAPVKLARGITLEIPHQLHSSTAMGVLDLAAMAGHLGRPVDAVLGGDLLGLMALGIFNQNHRLAFVPSGAINPKAGAHSRQFPLINRDELAAELNGQPVRLQVDLGSNQAVSLSDKAWHRIFKDDSKALPSVTVRAEGAKLPARYLPDNRLAFSGFQAEGVPVVTNGPLPGDREGLLGQAVLSKAEVVLDIPAKTMTFVRVEPATPPAAP
nr:retropepsin-like aspartic protease [Novosphingobium panipatense]